MQKKWLLLLSILLSLPLALADLGIVSRVWDRMMFMGNLGMFGLSDGGAVVALTRLLLGIVVFTVFFATITVFGGGPKADAGKAPLSFFNRGQAVIISLVLALMVMIFIPAEVILGVGVGWATAVALLLVGVPVLGIGALIWNMDKIVENKSETKGTIIMKIILCLLLLWILVAMRYHVGMLVGGAY